jgi:hypothetical protein
LATTRLTPTATNKSAAAHHHLSGTAADAAIPPARVNLASRGSKPRARARRPHGAPRPRGPSSAAAADAAATARPPLLSDWEARDFSLYPFSPFPPSPLFFLPVFSSARGF